MAIADWLLTAAERGDPDTHIDGRHAEGAAWTEGNDVVPPPHGATYFRHLLDTIEATRAGDVIMFTGWRGDPDEALDGGGRAVADVLGRAAARGVVVKGLIWCSHLDVVHFSAEQNRRLGREIEDAGGDGRLDMRSAPAVRTTRSWSWSAPAPARTRHRLRRRYRSVPQPPGRP